MVYQSAADPRGPRSTFIFVDPRRPESKAAINHKDKFILKDGFGTFVAVQSGSLVAGVSQLEDATLFQLDIIGTSSPIYSSPTLYVYYIFSVFASSSHD